MKKFLAFLTAAILTAAVFTGCGNSESKTPEASDNSQTSSQPSSQVEASANSSAYNLNDIVTAVEQVNPISNPREANDDFIQLDLLIPAEDVVEYAGKISNDQNNGATILAITAAEGKADEVKSLLEEYKAVISADGMYQDFVDMQKVAKDTRIVSKGNCVVMVIANTEGADYAAIDKALDEALK